MIKSKKIMLVVPSHEGAVGEGVTHEFFQNAAVKYMPLGVLSIAACLKDRHDVVVLDSSSKGYSIEQTLVEIEKESPDIFIDFLDELVAEANNETVSDFLEL